MTGGAAIELVRYSATARRFELNPSALDVLRAITTPVAVVAVCGRARQGKSFILNQLLSVTGGFQIGSTHRPCTKGLWMWSAPQPRVDGEGNPYHLVLLDTEGIDAYDQTAQYSTQIFSLAVLLSSLFVYNQMGGIDEAALDRLSLVAEMTKLIKVRSGDCSGGGSWTDNGGSGSGGWDAQQVQDARELRRCMPAFLWLLRDFYLKLEDEQGREVTAREYLEAALTPVPGGGPSVDAKNAIRASIKALFPDRDCAMLVRPMHEEHALVSLDATPHDQLRPEFRAGVGRLLQLILRKARPKRMAGHALTGPALAGLAEAYVAAINGGAVPTVATAWQGVAEQECRRGADAAIAAYCAAFDDSRVEAEEGDLEREHARAIAAARAAFAPIAIGDRSIRRAHESRALEACAARFAQVRGRKLAEAAATVNELLLGATTSLGAAAASAAASAAAAAAGSEGEEGAEEDGGSLERAVAVMEGELSRFLDGYAASARGPTKWPKLLDFLKGSLPSLLRGAAAAADERGRSVARRLRVQLEEARRRVAEQGARGDDLAKRLEAAEAEAAAAARRGAEQSGELATLRVALEQERSRTALAESSLAEARLLGEKRLASARQEGDARVRSEAARRVAVEAELGEARRRAESAEADAAESASRVRTLESLLTAAHEEGSGYLSQFAAAKREVAGLERDLEGATAALAAARLAAAAAARERDEALSELEALRGVMEDVDREIEAQLQEAEREVQRSGAAAALLPPGKLGAPVPPPVMWMMWHQTRETLLTRDLRPQQSFQRRQRQAKQPWCQ